MRNSLRRSKWSSRWIRIFRGPKTDSPTEPRAVSHSNGKILQLFGSRTSVKARWLGACPKETCHVTPAPERQVWTRPYVVERVYDGGAYQLIDCEGRHPLPPINGRYLKTYYSWEEAFWCFPKEVALRHHQSAMTTSSHPQWSCLHQSPEYEDKLLNLLAAWGETASTPSLPMTEC